MSYILSFTLKFGSLDQSLNSKKHHNGFQPVFHVILKGLCRKTALVVASIISSYGKKKRENKNEWSIEWCAVSANVTIYFVCLSFSKAMDSMFLDNKWANVSKTCSYLFELLHWPITGTCIDTAWLVNLS